MSLDLQNHKPLSQNKHNTEFCIFSKEYWTHKCCPHKDLCQFSDKSLFFSNFVLYNLSLKLYSILMDKIDNNNTNNNQIRKDRKMQTTEKTKIKWTEAKVLDVIKEARARGAEHASNCLEELENAGPKFRVIDEHANKTVGTLLDVCGFANLKIKARGKFYLLAKKIAADRSLRFTCGRGYYGGGRLNIFDSTFRQEMSVNTAACKGQAEVLSKYSIEAHVESRID